jgi:hypothetical protein
MDDSRPSYFDGFHLKKRKRPYGDIGVSDKGRYIRGFLGFFGSLGSAYNLLGNHFWRTQLEKLCAVDDPNQSRQLQDIVNKLSKRQNHFAADFASGKADAIERLARYTLSLARQQKLGADGITFGELLNAFHAERLTFKATHQNNPGAGLKFSRQSAKADLREAIQSFVAGGLLLQGCRATCRNCGRTRWLYLEEFKKSPTCPGCRTPGEFPIEPAWVYKVNELVHTIFASSGGVAVILTLGALGHIPQESTFAAIPGVDLYKTYKAARPMFEIDAACLYGGQFAIVEVTKNTDDFFGTGERQRILTVENAVQPDLIILGGLKGNAHKLQEVEQWLGMRVSGGCRIKTLLPDRHIFEPNYHPFF